MYLTEIIFGFGSGKQCEELLIHMVRKNEALYHIWHADYKKVHKKDEIWDSIAPELCSERETVKKRWKTLRDYYLQIKRHQHLPSGSASQIKQKWKHFKSMSFLEEVPKTRRTLGSVSLKEDKNSAELSTPVSNKRPQSIFVDLTLESDSPNYEPTTNSKRRKKEQKNANERFSELLATAVENIRETCQRMVGIRTEDDSLSSYYQSLAKLIESTNMPRAAVLQLNKKVGDLVFEEL